MRANVKHKERFKLSKKQDSGFKGESESLKIRAGTIAKFQKKATFGSTNHKNKIIVHYKFGKRSSSFDQAKKEAKNQVSKAEPLANKDSVANKKRANRKKASKNQENTPSVRTTIAKVSATQFIDKSFTLINQDEDTEGLSKFKDTAKSGRRIYKTAKKTKGFITKNEQFSNSVTSGKIQNIRFSTGKKGNVASKAVSKSINKQMKSKTIGQLSARARQAVIKGLTKAVSVATTSTPVGWIVLGVGVIILLFFGLLMMISNQSASASDNGSFYVKHWDGKDAYHSSLLAQRYGIKAEQIDSFIKNEGYTQVDSRATGKEFLRLQSISGIDVRMLVAFAQMESSFGTAGVAQQFPKANIFGYGAFDNDPNQGASWDNTRAVNEFRSTQIDSFGNRTIAIMDERAKAYHENTLKPGQYVYWTSLNAGKPRAAIAEKLDKWIDDHGGTPDPPGGYGPIGGGGAGLTSLDKMLGQVISGEFGGITGQCYAVSAYYANSITPGIILRNGVAASNIGTDYPWASWKWTVIKWPSYKDIRAGDIINFKQGANMGAWFTDPDYGHTGVVGKVLGNNQFLLYDQNPGPLKTWTVTFIPGDVSSVIRPPK